MTRILEAALELIQSSGFKDSVIKTEKGVIRDSSKRFRIPDRYIIEIIVAICRPTLLKIHDMKEWQYASFA